MEFWIGDRVLLKKSKRIGKYEGVKNDKHRINVDGKIVVTSQSNIIKLEDEQSTHSTQKKIQSTYARHFDSDTIDLHIEKINPSLVHANPIHIREYQLRVAREFVDFAVGQGWKFGTIIHGRGTGVLRSEIHHMLRLHDTIKGFHLTNNDGATEILLS